MQRQDDTRPFSPRAKLEQAIHLAKTGRKIQACHLFRDIVALQPVNQAAWLWLSAVATEKSEAEAALVQAKNINPAHPSLPQAEQWLAHRFSAAPSTKKSPVVKKQPPKKTAPPKPSKNMFKMFNSVAFGLVVVALVIGLLVLFLGLFLETQAAAQPDSQMQQDAPDQIYLAVDARARLETAWATQNWTAAIEILEPARQANPSSQAVKQQLANAYVQRGVSLRSKGFIEQALTDFERAAALSPNHGRVQQEIELASAYLAGTQDYQAGNWQAAIDKLETVWAQDSTYPNVRDLLYSAYYNLSLARQAAGELAQARQSLEAAVALRPDLSAPRRLMAELEFAMAPQTPLETSKASLVEDKAIVVGIAEQRMAVYDGDEQIFDFVVSTGEPGRDTAIGQFEIQNKIDVAYASTWNLDMPYWMGIYWAGPLQNGIHSLPIVKHTGYKLWDGYLGQRVSYGCVILSDEDAAQLYDWAEVGTKVEIVPSLDGWTPDSENVEE